MVTLFCAIVGVAGNAFSIDIDMTKTVDHLKKAIRNEKKNDLKAVYADKLELFLAKKDDDTWLNSSGVEALTLDGNGHPVGFAHMNVVGFPLNVVGLSEEAIRFEFTEEDVKEKRFPVHVLVVVPTELNAKRPRAEAIGSFRLSELVALAQHLNGARVGTRLEMPETVLGTSFNKGLFIRQEYHDVLAIITEQLTSNRTIRRILVVGSPGVGKSVFGVFLLLLFMKEKQDFAYRPIDDPLIYFTWNDTSGYKVSDTPRIGRSYDGIFDGKESGRALRFDKFKHAYVFASPRPKNYYQFVKEKCFKVYMNPWTKVECQRLANAIHADDEEWLRRYNLVGGKPRFLFSKSTPFDDLVECVKGGIPMVIADLETQVELYVAKVFGDQMKHLLFNLYREENAPSRSYLTYSSLIVEAMVSVRYNIQSAAEIRSLLRTTEPNLQAWRGKELEKFLLQDLATSTFEMRVLEGVNAGAITEYGPLNAASKIIEASSEIQNELVLNFPLSKIFPALDAVLVVPNGRRIIYAQATVSTAYPIEYQRLTDVYEHLKQRQEFQGYEHILLFIVSNDIYDGFTVQPYKNANDKNHTMRIDINLTQYVGKIIRQ